MASPHRASSEQKSLKRGRLSDNQVPLSPLVLAPLRAVVCHCGNPWECLFTPVQLQNDPAHKDVTQRPTAPGTGDSPDTVPDSSADPAASQAQYFGFSSLADARVGEQLLRTPPRGSRNAFGGNTRSPASAEDGSLSWTRDNAASFRSHLSDDQYTLSSLKTSSNQERPSSLHPADDPYEFSTLKASSNKKPSASDMPPLEGRGEHCANMQRHRPPVAIKNMLCCTRWKHTFRAASATSPSTAVRDGGKRDTGVGADTAKSCPAAGKSNEQGVVCGLLLYEGQQFLEGRLLYKQLNGGLCWNEATWKRLYDTLAPTELPHGSPGAATDPACQPSAKTDVMRALQGQVPDSNSPSFSSKTDGGGCSVVLHVINSSEHTKTAATGTETASLQTLPASEANRPTPYIEAESASTAEASSRGRYIHRSPRRPGRLHRSSTVCTISSDTDETGADGLPSANPTSREKSPTDGSSGPGTCPRNSGGAVRGSTWREARSPGSTGVSSGSGELTASAYTLSLVMHLGEAPCAIYVRLSEPIRLRLLTLAAGVAKLTGAVLLMQRLHAQEQQKLQEQYSACVEALQGVTEDLAALTAQQQKREDILLEGACRLLNEKKRKLQALQQRVTFLEEEIQRAGSQGGTRQSAVPPSHGPCHGKDFLTAGTRGATTIPSDGDFNEFAASADTGSRARTSTASAPSRRPRNEFSRIRPALPASQSRRARSSGISSHANAVPSSGIAMETSAGHSAVASFQQQSKCPAGLFLVENKELFSAAFACIRVKEEMLEA